MILRLFTESCINIAYVLEGKDGEVKTDVNDLDGLRSVLESMNKTVNSRYLCSINLVFHDTRFWFLSDYLKNF